MDEKKDDEETLATSSDNCDSSNIPTRLAVDRDWIVKLLQRYSSSSSHHHANDKTTTTASSLVRKNPNTYHDNNNNDDDNDCCSKINRMDHHQEDDIFRNKALVVAPMVDQSDLPFRLLCRNYGVNFAFTPMIHARLFCHSTKYRTKFFNLTMGTPSEDRPLIAQICGSDVSVVVQTAKYLEPFVDGIDINCGCPQQIAKRGQYGAFLLEQEEMLVQLIHHLVRAVQIPISVKVRL